MRSYIRTLIPTLLLLLVISACGTPSVIVINPTPTATAPTVVQTVQPGVTRYVVPSTSTAVPPTRSSDDGDLGLAQRISAPDCDGRYVVIVTSIVRNPYPDQVRAALGRNPGSYYLRTDRSCSSLSPATASGDPIYAVYDGPFGELADACSRRAQIGEDAYVKVLDQSSPSAGARSCTTGGG